MLDARLPSVVVTAYNRPDGLARVLDDLEREGLGGSRVHIYDDASPHPDTALEQRVADLGCTLHRAERHHGKHGWWRWWNTILASLKNVTAEDELVLVLQDDVRLCREFTSRALELFLGIDDPQRTTLHLHVSAERAGPGTQCWTPVRAAPFGNVLRTGWVDMGAFLAHRRLFEALQWRLDPVPSSRWARQDVLGSGVGEQISRRAHAAGLGMYQVRRSLVVHDHTPSQMNPTARFRWPMRTVDFVDGDAEATRLAAARPSVLASVASIPSRTDGLREVVQIDEAPAVGKRGCLGVQDPQRQPGLSDAARPAQGKRPGHAQQLAQLRELAFTAHEAVWFLGQMSPDLVYLVTVQPASPLPGHQHSGADGAYVHVQPGETRITTAFYIWGRTRASWPAHFAAIEYIATYIVLPMPWPARCL